MTLPIEIDSRMSEELSAFTIPLLDNPDIDVPVTLGFVRRRIRGAARAQGVEPLPFGFGESESLAAEIEALIDEFGEDVPAADFVVVKASEELSRFIETLLDLSDIDIVPTLGGMRAAIAEGWVARLAGEGLIDEDEDQTLCAELDALIDRYGEDTAVESVLRFE